MTVIDKLHQNHLTQLQALYDDTWFAQGRSGSEIELMLQNSPLTLGLIEEDQLIGFCRGITDGVYKAFLFDIIIHNQYQGQGLGQKLVKAALDHKTLKDIPHVELYCPEEISGFYHTLGFKTRESKLLRLTR